MYGIRHIRLQGNAMIPVLLRQQIPMFTYPKYTPALFSQVYLANSRDHGKSPAGVLRPALGPSRPTRTYVQGLQAAVAACGVRPPHRSGGGRTPC